MLNELGVCKHLLFKNPYAAIAAAAACLAECVVSRSLVSNHNKEEEKKEDVVKGIRDLGLTALRAIDFVLVTPSRKVK